jgi:PadR family transcriptional regulator AphA
MYRADISCRYMNSQLTPTARVILGMIRLGRRTGYEIKQLVDVSTRFFWAASYGQIYPELARLEEGGLVEGEPDPTSGRRRREYRLTPKGEKALDDWLASSDDLIYELRDEGLLKLFFSDSLEPEKRIELVRAMRDHQQAIVDHLEAIEPGVRKKGPQRVVRYGLRVGTMEVQVCEDMEKEFKAEYGAVA